jgi:biopolymer transport protein ExbD
MARFSKGKVDSRSEIGLTPMIDVVFLLLVFFILSAKFIIEEEQLDANLPRRGRDSEIPLPATALTELIIDLRWAGDRTVATARLTGFGEGGEDHRKVFPTRFDPLLDAGAPDFRSVESFFAKSASRFGRDLPVTIHIDDAVPVQMLVSTMDACLAYGLEDVGLAAPEIVN